MLRAGALRRLTTGLFLVAVTAVGTSACLLVPVSEPYIGAPAVVAPAPVIVVPRRPHYHYRGGYYHGGYHRGGGHRWR
jgi:hypothetical protein